MPNDVSSGTPKTNSPDMATATVSAENTTVVPAELDGGDDGVVDVEAVAAFLAEPVDHQQPVVDAQADAEHVDDVDREDRHVAERGGADEDGEGGDDPADGDEQRHPAGDEPAEEHDHGDDGDRQGDRLALEQVVLRRGGEGLADQHVATDEDLGCIELVRDVLDALGERELVVLVEVAGEGDDDERGASVGRPKGISAGRPGVDDVEHAVELGDVREAGGQPLLDLRVVDVDAVGDDGDLAHRSRRGRRVGGRLVRIRWWSRRRSRSTGPRTPSCRRWRSRGAARPTRG